MKNARRNASSIKKRILKGIAVIFIAIIPICFVYSLIMLLIEPSSVFVIENR